MGLLFDNDAEKYQTLVVSLPHLPLSFHDSVRPLSPVIFEDRLEMLQAEDRSFYDRVLKNLKLEKNCNAIDDSHALSLQQQLEGLAPTEAIQKLFGFLHDVRIIVGALRLRKNDMDFTEKGGTMVSHIKRNWNHPSFKLGEQFPWIEDIRLLLEQDDIAAAHRRMSEIIWKKLVTLSEIHFFDFTAVLLYVLRWNMVSIWAHRDVQKGNDCFQKIVEEVIGNHGELFS